jgi:hypothetical protein
MAYSASSFPAVVSGESIMSLMDPLLEAAGDDKYKTAGNDAVCYAR